MIRPRMPHHIDQVAHHFLDCGRLPAAGSPLPAARRALARTRAPRPPGAADPQRIATLAATESAGRFAQRLARAAGDWSALGQLTEALELIDPVRPCRTPLDALVCCLAGADEVPAAVPAQVASFLASCGVRRLILLLVLPGRIGGPAARERAEAAAALFTAASGGPISVLCLREEDLREPMRAAAVLGAARVAVCRLAAGRAAAVSS